MINVVTCKCACTQMMCVIHCSFVGTSISWGRNSTLSSNKELPGHHWTSSIWCIWGNYV